LRLDLQQSARRNLRRHALRAGTRFLVLVLSDLATFGLMRELIRFVRDQAVLGVSVAFAVQDVLPRGILNGWQFAAALLLSLLVLGCYGAGDQRRDPRRLFAAAAFATALPLWMTIWTRGLAPVLVQYFLTTTLIWIGLLAERLVVDRIVAWVRPPAQHAARTLFVGQEDWCREVMASGTFATGTDFMNLGYLDTRLPPAPGALGQINELPHVLRDADVETLVVCGYLSDHRFHDVVDLALAAGCQVLTVPRSLHFAGVQPSVVWRHDRPFIELTTPSLKGWQLVLKRAVDIVGAVVGLVVFAPVMLFFAVAITLDSPGPIFFRQERIGTGGRRFQVLKFRTMRNGASDAAHRELVGKMLRGDETSTAHAGSGGAPVYKLVKDERVTRVGRWLRGTSLDELPQFFNVLRGDMSLVGPRPPLPYEFEAYDQWQFDRLQVHPGITGLWQVSGRNLLTYRQMCELDVTYVRNWSLWLDLKILLKTIPVVLFNSGRAA
jgi:exopolysaccharide biosynthesis polyprenyl glycosylphosphotransferase